MTTPNRLAVVQDVNRDEPAWLRTNTRETCTQFRQEVARRLYQDDTGWGELTKRPGETQGTDGRAVDAIIYGPTQQVIDIIGGAEGGPTKPGRPTWQEVPKRPENHWITPIRITQAPEPEAPAPGAADDRPCLAALARLAAAVETLTARVVALEDVRGHSVVVGTTSREWGHTHTLRAPVVVDRKT